MSLDVVLGGQAGDQVKIHFTLIANDRIGLIFELTDIVANHGFNIVVLDAARYGRPRTVACITAILEGGEPNARSTLRTALERLAIRNEGTLVCFGEGRLEYLVGTALRERDPGALTNAETAHFASTGVVVLPERLSRSVATLAELDVASGPRTKVVQFPVPVAGRQTVMVKASVTADDRVGLVRDVAEILVDHRMNLLSLMSAPTGPDGLQGVWLETETEVPLQSIAGLLKKIQDLDSVRSVIQEVQEAEAEQNAS